MSQTKEPPLMEKIVSLCKRRGFIFQSSEIYGGINGFWDYGPLGAELKRNLRETWWRAMTRDREDVVGLDAGGRQVGDLDPISTDPVRRPRQGIERPDHRDLAVPCG